MKTNKSIIIKIQLYNKILKLTTPKKTIHTDGYVSFSTAIEKLYCDAIEYRKLMENVV